MMNLEARIFTRVESVHATEALARRTATQQVYFTFHWQTLTSGVLAFTLVHIYQYIQNLNTYYRKT